MDYTDSWERIERSGLPFPTYVACNPDNGHAHAAWMLELPVLLHGRHEPRSFLVDVAEAFSLRLSADPRYNGGLTKNPVHRHWHVDWQAKRPYRLDELNDSLDRADKRKILRTEPRTMEGRNNYIFETVRKYGYSAWRKFQKDSATNEEFKRHLLTVAQRINFEKFPDRLLPADELRSIAKSAAGWTCENFSMTKFREIQRARIARRWAKAPTLTALKPWEAAGVSRRTWERKRRQSREKPDMVLRQTPNPARP